MATTLCPQNDRQFVQLAKDLELCAGQRDFGCDDCPQRAKCIRQWEGVSNLSTIRKLTRKDYNKRSAIFTTIMAKAS